MKYTALMLLVFCAFGCVTTPTRPFKTNTTQMGVTSIDTTQATKKIKQKPQTQDACQVLAVSAPRPGAVTREALIGFAMGASPLIPKVRAQLLKANALRANSITWTPFNPTVSVGTGLRQLPNGYGLDLNVEVSQKFELGGKRGLRRSVWKANVLATKKQIQAQCWALRAEINASFYQALLDVKRLELTKKLVTANTRTLDIALARANAGQISETKTLVLKVDLAHAQQQYMEAKAHQTTRIQRLKALSGWPQDRALVLKGKLPTPSKPPRAAVLVAHAMTFNPTLLANAESIKQHKAQSQLEQQATWIDPTVGLSYGREGGAQSTHIYMLSLSVDLPTFDKNQLKRAQSNANIMASRAQLDATQQQLRGDVLQTWTKINGLVDQLNLYQKSIAPSLDRDMKTIEKSYKEGAIGLFSVSQTQQRILSIELGNLRAMQRYIQAQTTLERLIGMPLEHIKKDTKP